MRRSKRRSRRLRLEAWTASDVARQQLGWLLGGRDVQVLAASFALEGDVPGTLWWVLPMESAERLGQRLLRRPGVTGPLASRPKIRWPSGK